MLQKNKSFVNIQKLIGLQIKNKKAVANQAVSISPAMHMSSYDLVDFLHSQMQRADTALARHELNMTDVSRIAKKRL